MEKKAKKLVLTKQTLRDLVERELTTVQGGASNRCPSVGGPCPEVIADSRRIC